MLDKNLWAGLRKKDPKNMNAWVGFDGTVDKIVAAVHKRSGPGENYEAIPTIAAWGKRISAAAGKSTNIELFLKQEKIGGNAAIMAGSLAAAGAQVTLVGDLGQPKVHAVFGELAKKATLKSLGEPTETHAVEFTDGKVMLGYTRNHEAITFENVMRAVGGKAQLQKTLGRAQLIALVNWTMTPGMTEIFKRLEKEILPKLPKMAGRLFFFDLADPEKRPVKELKEALLCLGRFSRFGRAVLGLNFKETQQVMDALGLGAVEETQASIKIAARKIKQALGLHGVVVHTVDAAGCATPKGEFWMPGPYVKKPKITTGAGDHFNAGFALSLAQGATELEALCAGVAFSGYYVRTGKSPKMKDALDMIKEGW